VFGFFLSSAVCADLTCINCAVHAELFRFLLAEFLVFLRTSGRDESVRYGF
jgi:hypothetical protein